MQTVAQAKKRFISLDGFLPFIVLYKMDPQVLWLMNL